jgi:hypothetical protein
MAVVTCPNCDARLKAPDGLSGKRVKCPGCSRPFSVRPDVPDPEETACLTPSENGDCDELEVDELPRRLRKRRHLDEVAAPPLLQPLLTNKLLLIEFVLWGFPC